jgi:O-succinylhomoserine sulfhydrylase
MTDINDHDLQFETRAVRAGQRRTMEQEHSEAIFPTSSFVFGSAREAAARFSGEEPGNVYSRFTNPTVRTFSERLASMEGGETCVATASGMSAILSVCLSLLSSGDHLIAARGLFGSTTQLFSNYLTKFGIGVSFVSVTDIDAWREAVTPSTKLFFLETPSNPLMEVADLPRLAELAHTNDIWLVVDNCFCTPALQQPLSLGADIVVHSATKFLMSPFNAWVFLKGLETLTLRMREHCANAARVAMWLQQQPSVTQVYYPGLSEHPQHAVAARQQSGFGGLVSFEVAGERDAAWRLIDNTRLLSITANLGDAKTTITHPASTTHGRLSAADREAAGIYEGLLRVSVGLESAEDIIVDLERGLNAR